MVWTRTPALVLLSVSVIANTNDILIGFQVSKTQYDKVWGYIESGKSEGAHLLIGGTKRNVKGYFVDPTSESWCN